MQNIKELKTKKFRWINVVNANKDNLKYLKQEFGFETTDLNECLPTLQRPKILDHDTHIFIVLRFPFYERDTGTIESGEIDIFISKQYLITVHTQDFKAVDDLFTIYETDQVMKGQLETEDASSILYKIANKLYNDCYPLLNGIDEDMGGAEKNVLGATDEKTIRNLLLIKRNIVDFQKIMQSHFHIWQKFIDYSQNFKHSQKKENNYFRLIDYTKDIWDYLKNYKDTVNAMHETQESMTTLKINEIMKTLTIFSVVVFPLTLLAAIFGMNTMNSMPFVNSPYDFWYIMGIMLVGMLIMFGFFKRRKWL